MHDQLIVHDFETTHFPNEHDFVILERPEPGPLNGLTQFCNAWTPVDVELLLSFKIDLT